MFSDFKIIMPLKVRETIQYFVDQADKEISGLGDATIDLEEKTVTISSAFLLDQECTAATTDLDEGAVSKAMFAAHKDEQEGKPRSIKFWWHSHVNMAVFWSSTDTATMKELSEHGWFVNIVFNKKREMLGAISYPVEMRALNVVKKSIQWTSDIDISIPGLFTTEELGVLDAEMKEKYKVKVYTPPKYVDVGGRGTGSYNWKGDREAQEYFEGVYGPGFADFDASETFEVGEKMNDGAICLHWEENFQMSCFEGDEIKPDEVWFRTRGTQGWVCLEDEALRLSDYFLQKLSTEALDTIYIQLEHYNIFPILFKKIKNLYIKSIAKTIKESEKELRSGQIGISH